MNKMIISLFIPLFFITNINAETVTCDSLDASITNLGTIVTDQQALVSKLSDDIGVMADRIGDMADKIVLTETLLSQTLLTITGNTTLTNAVILLSPLDSTTASKTIASTLTLSDSASQYILYASKSPTFSETNSIKIYIDSTDTLSRSWTQVSDFAATNSDVIYIAIKSINNNIISTLSNGVKLTLQ